MAMWLSVIRKLYDRIPDWAWPHLTGDAEPAPEDQDIFSVEHVDSLDEITSILSSRLVQLEERTRGVESKLLALLTLTSVLSTAVAASLAAATTLGSVKEDARLLAWFAVFLSYMRLSRFCVRCGPPWMVLCEERTSNCLQTTSFHRAVKPTPLIGYGC